MVRLSFLLLLIVPPIAVAQVPHALLTPEETAWVVAHPSIRLMGDSYYEPSSFFENGRHKGIAADVLELVAARTGLNFEVVEVPLPRRLVLDPKVRGIDGVACSTRTPERDRFYNVTTPYLVFPAYIITRNATPKYLSAADLDGLTVAVVAGYAVEEYLRTNYPLVKLEAVPNTDVALKKVSFGVVDAFVTDIPVTTFWVEQAGYTNLKVSGETGFIYRLGISSRKDWPELGRILQKGIDTLTPEEHDAIRRKWLKVPYESAFRSAKFLQAFLGMAVGAFSSIAVLFLWNRLLARRVKQKTLVIRESESLFRSTLENVSDAVLLADSTGHFVRIFPGKGGYLVPPNSKALFGTEFEQRVATASEAGLINAEVEVTGLDGQPRQLLVNVVPVSIGAANRMYVCRDVSERLRLEALLRQKQRLESVGLLASGVAHDFNNLLQAIQGFAGLAKRESLLPEERADYLGQVEDATHRAATLTRQLLAFARKQPSAKRKWNLTEIVGEMMPLVRQLVGRHPVVNYEASEPFVWVTVDRAQVEQVVLNLCVNARDATPKEGNIGVAVGTDATGPYLQVSDTGVGMSDGVRLRIFEPFFTTKPDGKGTGLGLAVVYGIVEDHGGRIEVGSSPGHGTTITVWWPALRAPETVDEQLSE